MGAASAGNRGDEKRKIMISDGKSDISLAKSCSILKNLQICAQRRELEDAFVSIERKRKTHT